MLDLRDANLRHRRALRCSLLSAASLLCLAVPQAPLWAQTYEEPPTVAPAAPAPANSVDGGAIAVPPKTPNYFLSTYRSYMYAPLPAKIWKQGGIPTVVKQSEQFANPHGKVGNYNVPGATITANNAFFQSLGTNGRSCVTCHNPPSGLGLSLKNIKARFRSNLNDPLFAPVDGANCPDAVPAQYTSGSLYGGNKGKGKKALKEAYSMLLTRGLIRVGIKVPGKCRVHRQGAERQAGLQSEPGLQQGSGDRRDDPVDVPASDPVGEPPLQGSERRSGHIGPDQRDVGRARAEPAHAGNRRDPGPCAGDQPADRGAGRPDRRLRDQVLHRADPRQAGRQAGHKRRLRRARCICRAGRRSARRLPAAAGVRRIQQLGQPHRQPEARTSRPRSSVDRTSSSTSR